MFKTFFIIFSIILTPISAAAQNIETLLMFGDSLTQGYGLQPEDGLVNQLQNSLNEDNIKVNLINAGISGDTTAGGDSRIDWSLTSNIDAVVVALGGNDMLRGINPKHTKKRLENIVVTIKEKNIPITT
jgi:acyl-CoA thioesterase-1